MNVNGFNLVSIEKFDEALKNVNSLSSCNISKAMTILNSNGISSKYAEISNGISDIKNSISRLANGAGPEGLIDNYKSGYEGIKNAIIEAYISEYKLALESGSIMNNSASLKNLSEGEKNKIISELGDVLKNMNNKNSNPDSLFQYASLTEFFREVKNVFSKYSVSLENIVANTSNLQPKNNRDIAHRGFHTIGGLVDNSYEAFKLAGEKGFWGCEADVRFDSNGNLVCSHNAVKEGQNPATFEEYLDLCKQYGMTAIIDLKYEKGVGHADSNLSPAILKVIKEKGMMDSCVLQTNNSIDIPYIRENSKDARIWYLTDSISDKNINLIEENGVECVNLSSGENITSKIKKITAKGIDVCVWNVQTEKLKDTLLNVGAKYIMSDNVLGITPYQTGEENLNDSKFNLKEDAAATLLDAGIGMTLDVNTSSSLANTLTSSDHLTARMGHIDGPEAYETWYDLDMSTVVNNMEEVYGYTNVKAGIRDDGVKVISGTAPDGTTFKDLVMVAADVRHEVSNPYGTYERGQIVDTTLGKGIVVDACRLAIDKRETNQGNHFDIATAWWTGKYSTQAYSKDNNVKLTEAVNNVTYKETGEPPITSTSNKINTSNSTANTNSSVNTSKPSTSTNTPIYTSNTPNYSSGSSSSNSSSSSSSTTVPSYSNDTSSSHGTSATPPIDLDTTITNILPENKFSYALPQISSGNLGTVEIGKNSINYELYEVSDYVYSDYVKALIDKGYTMTDYGKFIKDNCEVITTITKDGNMSISLNIK